MSEHMPAWDHDLYRGAAGIALLQVEYAYAGATSWEAADRSLVRLIEGPIATHYRISSLYRGAPAVAFVLHTAARSTYASALAVLDEHIVALTQVKLAQASRRIDEQELPALGEYNLVRGLTGIGAYLLHRNGDTDLLRQVLSYLVRLTRPLVTRDNQTLPGWWTPNAPTDQLSSRWPGGHANLGLAHGIAGPLALLGLAMRHGIIVSGQAESIERVHRWLDRWQCGPADRPWWPTTITPTEFRTGTSNRRRPGRPSWCHGLPGLARAQQLAALATADTARKRAAENALARCIADDYQVAQLTDGYLCHGSAGLMLTAARVAADSFDPEAFAITRLLSRTARHATTHRPVAEEAGLFDGPAGIHLATHTVAAGVPPTSGWDACLLLGPGRTVTETSVRRPPTVS